MSAALEHRVKCGATDLRESSDLDLRDTLRVRPAREVSDGRALGPGFVDGLRARSAVALEVGTDVHADNVKHLTSSSQERKVVYMPAINRPVTFPGYRTAPVGTRVRHVRSGATGTLAKPIKTPAQAPSAGNRYAVIDWDNGHRGRVSAPAYDLEQIEDSTPSATPAGGSDADA